MAQVPEYLLERSRERRAALGLPPFGGGEAPAPAAPSEGGDAPAAGAEAAPPAEAVPAPTEAPVPAVAEAQRPATTEPEVTPYLALPSARSGIPAWVVPVLALLPIWAFAYLGALSPPSTKAAVLTPIQQGAQLFAKNCAQCHGTTGEGGVGPQLAGGQAKLTFPNEADQIKWVETGSAPHKGQPYGDPSRPGGQHIAKSGGMPSFQGTLTAVQIQDVVTYERDGLK